MLAARESSLHPDREALDRIGSWPKSRGLLQDIAWGPDSDAHGRRADSACRFIAARMSASRQGLPPVPGLQLSTAMKLLILLASIAGCGTVAAPALPDGDPLLPDASPTVTPECAADPAQCLYQPTRYTTIQIGGEFVGDANRIGGPRRIPIAYRYAVDAPRPMPVVVLSHGGAGGSTDAASALEEWATAAAAAGYFAVAVAHEPRDQASRQLLCDELAVPVGECDTFKYLNYDRPLDLARVIDRVYVVANDPAWTGMFDPAKLAVLGHSAGAGGTLMLAGAPRDVFGTPLVGVDPRPIAFVALSPQAPGSEGFTEAGYGQITRPTLIATGRGDENPPDTADGRATVFDVMQPGNKARLFIEDPAALHMVFSHQTASCITLASLERCEQLVSWVESATLAFLDTHLRGAPAASAWLDSTNLGTASEGAAEWSRR
jgi:dienelactone hydrolase